MTNVSGHTASSRSSLLTGWPGCWASRTNTAITTFKLIIPAFTGLSLVAAGFHHENFSVGTHGGAHSTDLAAVLTAVALGIEIRAGRRRGVARTLRTGS